MFTFATSVLLRMINTQCRVILFLCFRCPCVWLHSHEQQDVRLHRGPGRWFGSLLLSGLHKGLWPQTCPSSSPSSLDYPRHRCNDCHHVDLLHGLPAHLYWSCTGILVLQVNNCWWCFLLGIMCYTHRPFSPAVEKSMLVLMLALEVNIELACVVLCAYRKRTIMSEYGPILDSNNPLSLNSDNPDQGIVIQDNESSSFCNLFVVLVIALVFRCNTKNNFAAPLLRDVN